MTVYACGETNFGDCIIFICGLLKQVKQSDILISTTTSNRIETLKEIASNMLYSNRFKFVDTTADVVLKGPDIDEYDRQYFPMKMMWEKKDTNMVSYQLTGGIYNGELKNTPDDDLQSFLTFMKQKDHFPIEVGKQYSVGECIALMSDCDFHVTIDSGMMHLACCLGIPIKVIKNDFMYSPHVLSNVSNLTVYNNMKEFIEQHENTL